MGLVAPSCRPWSAGRRPAWTTFFRAWSSALFFAERAPARQLGRAGRSAPGVQTGAPCARRRTMPARASVHAPHAGDMDVERANWHAHLLITTRRIEGEGFAAKKARDLEP